MYVTVERFKTLGHGIDLTDVQDYEIAAKLDAAAGRIHAITAAPQEPQPHDFRGGTITAEQHLWNLGDGQSRAPSRSLWVRHYPLISVSALQIDLTNNRYITIAEDERYLTRRTIEIVSLAMTANGIFGAAVLPEIGLLNPQWKATYVYGRLIPMTGATLERITTTTYRAIDQWWDSTATTTIYADGSPVSPASIDYDEGLVTFAADPGETVKVTADYTTKLPRNIALAESILAVEALGDRENRARGMSGLQAIRVGEISLEAQRPSRGGQTLVTPAEAQAEALVDGFRFISAGAA